MRSLCNDIKLYSKTLHETTVRDFPIIYSLHEMKTKLPGNSRIFTLAIVMPSHAI